MSSQNVLPFISVIITAIGLFALLREYHRSNITKKADYLDRLILRLRSDNDIKDIVYSFQYGTFSYDDSFHNTELERRVDKALNMFSFVCYLKRKRVLRKDEFCFFQEEIMMALSNHEVDNYLYNLYHFECSLKGIKSSSKKVNHFTFGELLRFGIDNKLLPDTFFDPMSYRTGMYKKYLNF